MTPMLVSGGRVVDPASGLDAVADVLVVEGKVAAMGPDLRSQCPPRTEILDARGLVVAPGLIDIHVHFREPGQTKKEDVQSGSRCAVRGGFSTVVCMPNTSPAIDNAGTVALIQDSAAKAQCRVEITGALTKGIAGEELAPIGSLHKAGVVALTDDGHCIQNNDLMRRACEYARMFDLPIMDHCQDYGLVTKGVMHEGKYSTILGLAGWPAAGEELIVARNILLAEQTGTVIHCQHLSSAGSVRLLREARGRGVPISGEACPHHFTLTDACIAGSEEFWREDGVDQAVRFFKDTPLPEWPNYHTDFKMNPPLRSARDREAILEGLVDGTLAIISSDHAPHSQSEKDVEFDYAPFGIVGLETELALSLMALVHSGRLSLIGTLAKLTSEPAKLLRFQDGRGEIRVGGVADLTLFNLNEEWTSSRDETASKSSNNPFHGWRLRGRVLHTIVGGQRVWSLRSVG